MIDHIQKQLCLTLISKIKYWIKFDYVQEKPGLPDVTSICIGKTEEHFSFYSHKSSYHIYSGHYM